MSSLTDEEIEKIKNEYLEWEDVQYANKDLSSRQEISAFFTPPELTKQMLDKLGDFKEDETLLDPCLGAGGLLAAAIVTGKVKPENCYGIEIDEDILKIAKKRLGLLGVPEKNLHHGSALNKDCYVFDNGEEYSYDVDTDTVTFGKPRSKSMPKFGRLRATI